MRTNLIKTKELPKVVESSTTDGMLDMVIAFDTTLKRLVKIQSNSSIQRVESQ